MAVILSRPQCVNPTGAEVVTFQETWVNVMAADDLAL